MKEAKHAGASAGANARRFESARPPFFLSPFSFKYICPGRRRRSLPFSFSIYAGAPAGTNARRFESDRPPFFSSPFYPYICPGRRRYSLPIPPLKAIYAGALVGERTRRFKSGHPPFFQLSPFMKRPGRRHRSLLSPLKTVYAGRSLGGFSFLIQKDVEFTGSNPVAGALVEITTPADGPKVCPRNIEV